MASLELTPRQQNILDFVAEFQQQKGYPPSIREIGEFFGIRSTNGVSDHLRALERKGFLSRNGHLSRSLQVVRGDDREAARFVPDPEAFLDRASAPGTPNRDGVPNSDDPLGDAFPTRPHDPAIARTTATGRTLSLARTDSSPAGRAHAGLRAPIAGGVSVAVPMLGRVAAGQPMPAIEDAEDSIVVDSYLLGGPGEVFGLRVVGESMIDAGIFPGDFLFVRKRATAQAGEIVVAMIDGEATVKRWFPEGDRIRLQPENAAMKPIFIHRADFRAVDLLGTVVGIYRKLI